MNNKNRKEKLKEIRFSKNTVILYEAPHKLKDTLKDLKEINSFVSRPDAINAQINAHAPGIGTTFMLCFIASFTTSSLIEKVVEPKGEYVIIIEKNKQTINEDALNELSVEEHYRFLLMVLQ